MAVSDQYITSLLNRGWDGMSEQQRQNFLTNVNRGAFSTAQQQQLGGLFDMVNQVSANGMAEDGGQIRGPLASPAQAPQPAPVQQPQSYADLNQMVSNLSPLPTNNVVDAMWGDDIAGPGSNRQYGEAPVNYNQQDIQALANQIIASGQPLVQGNTVYAFQNPALNEALYGREVAQNLSYDQAGFQTPRHLQQPDRFASFLANLPLAVAQAALGNVIGGAIGIGGAGGAIAQGGGTSSLLLDAARRSTEEVNDSRDDQGTPTLGGLMGAIDGLPNTGWRPDFDPGAYVENDELLNEILSQGRLEGETWDEYLDRLRNVGPERNNAGGGGGADRQAGSDAAPGEEGGLVLGGGAQGNPEEIGEEGQEGEARYVVIEDGVWRDNATGELIYGPGGIGQTTDDEGMGVLWETGDYSWERVDETQEDVEDEEDSPWVTLDPYGDLVWGSLPGILTGDMSDIQTNEPSIVITQNPSGQPTANPGGSQNGMGPDGGQIGDGNVLDGEADGELPQDGTAGDGTTGTDGTGSNGSGDGDNGTGEGDGGDGTGDGGSEENDGDGDLPITNSLFGGGGETDWGDLFPYTAIAPSRPAQLGGFLDYVAALRGRGLG